jgi:carboxymethylenebutenolidase
MYEGMIAESVALLGHGGDRVDAYAAHPIGSANVPGMVVLHHMPGWDEWTREVVRKLAHHGYAAIAPHLFSRLGPGAWDDLAAAARSAGGMPDEQVMGDLDAAAKLLRMQPISNGKVGVIGFCSGGRQAYLAACTVDGLDAAVDCWGGRVIVGPEGLNERQPRAPIEFTSRMHMPLLGIFGNEDANPDVEQVNRTEAELQKFGKEYEFHRYDGAGHGFFATDRPGYRQAQAVEGWQVVFAFLDRHLKTSSAEGTPVSGVA